MTINIRPCRLIHLCSIPLVGILTSIGLCQNRPQKDLPILLESVVKPANPLVGAWTYRSFISDPDVTKPFNDLEFGAGTLTIEDAPFGTFKGRLVFGDTQQLVLTGTLTYGNPFTARFQGRGDKADSLDWVYDYTGYVVQQWPNGIDQRPAVVGTIVRTEDHKSGKSGIAKKGVVAQWIAIKQDSGSPLRARAAKKSVKQTTHQIEMHDSFYKPTPKEINVGDAMVWIHKGTGTDNHTATADDGSFDTGEIEPGNRSNPITFNKAGDINYHCLVHGKMMSGLLKVKARAAPDEPRVSPRPASAAVKEFFAAFGKGDIPAALTTLSPDVDWLIAGSPRIPYAGPRHGRDGVNKFFKAFLGGVDVLKFEPREFVEQDSKVVVVGHEDLRVKANGKTVHNEWAMIFTVVGGKISAFRSYEDTAALESAFTEGGLPNESKKTVNSPSQPCPVYVDFEEGKKQANGVELYCKAIGRGEPIVIVHGGPGLEHTLFLPQFGRLAKHHRLVFYDQRASGRSTGKVDEASINMPTFVSDLDEIRGAFGIQKMNLLGYSWGGLLAMSYATKHPEKVKHLILVDSEASNTQDDNTFTDVLRARTSPAEQQELDRLRMSAEFQQGDLPTFRAWLRLRFRAYFAHPEKIKRLVLDDLTPQTAKNFLAINEMFDKTFFTPGYDLTKDLSSLKCPTLIVHGDYDPIQPMYLKKVSCLIEGSNFWQLRDCGHFSYIERAEELFGQIELFLKK